MLSYPQAQYTVKDVARLAGVSIWTVSAVINNKGKVSPPVAERVLQAMDALNYRPNIVARSLKIRESRRIGMSVPDITNPFFADLIAGIGAMAREFGYSLIICDSREDPIVEQTNLQTLMGRGADGILWAPTSSRLTGYNQIRRHCPMVVVDRIHAGFKGPAVVSDNYGGAYEATKYLLVLGHRRIAIITGRLSLSICSDRLKGYQAAMKEASLPLRDEYVQQGDFQYESGYEAGLKLLGLPEPPTAVFSSNNKMTLGLMRALKDCGASCPQDVSVLGFDDFEWAANFSPRLTTVAQLSYEMGRLAAEMLLTQLRGSLKGDSDKQKTVVVLKTELHVRDSTAPPPKGK